MPHVVRLDSMLAPGLNQQQASVIALDSVYESAILRYAEVAGMDSAGVGELAMQLANSRANEIFYPDVMKKYPSFVQFAEIYGKMHSNASELIPGMNVPDTVVTVVSPFRQMVFFADGVAFIASNHFLGEDYPGYESFPASERAMKTPQRMVPAIAEALLRINYPYEPTTPPSALSAMMREGAIYALLEQLIPDADTHVILGFNESDMRWLNDNRHNVWQQIVGANMLFTTDRSVVGRLVDSPQPLVLPNNMVLPPRIGRYLGYELVKQAIQKNIFTDASQLLTPDYQANPAILRKVTL